MAVMQMSMKKLEVGWRRYMMNRITNHDIIVTDNELLEPILAEYIANGREFVILSTKPFEDVSPHIRENLDENHYYMGDPTRNEVLEHVGVKRASTIIIALGDDSENIYTLVTARAIAPGIKTVVRVNHDDAREKFRSVGADVVLPTGTVMGRMLSQAAISSLIHQFLLGLNTHTMDPFLKESSVSVKEVGKQVREVHKRAAAVYRKNSFIYDLNNLELQKGDVVISIEKNGA
jgi:voltage-gated potassium channel